MILVCVLPPLEVRQQLRKKMEEYSRQLNSRRALIFPPHITLVNRFKTARYQEFIKECKEICAKTPRFSLRIGPLGRFNEPRVLFLDVHKTPELQHLHTELLELSVAFKEPWVRPRFKDLSTNEQQQEYLEKYGSPFVKEFYEPHISLAGTDIDPDLFEELNSDEEEQEIPIDKIYILRETQEGWKIDNVLPLA